MWLLPLSVAVVVAAVVVPLVLTNDGDEPSPRASTGSSSTADEPVEEVDMPEEIHTPRPKDRDPNAVRAALDLLDPCKLLDLDIARQRGKTEAVTIPGDAKNKCLLAPRPDYDPIRDFAIELTVGVRSDHADRWSRTPLTIGGARAYELSDIGDRSTCRVVIPVSFTRGVELIYRLDGNEDPCPTVRQYAEGTVAKLRDPDAVSAPAAGVAPQRPLLYGPDENDTGAVGDCVDYGGLGGQKDCEPYHEVPIPGSPEQIMAATKENRNVQCAVFKDAVEEVFAEDFVPVTWAAHCFFVDPTHVFDIRVNVDPDNRPSDYGKGDLYRDREETTVAGLRAVTFWTDQPSAFNLYLSPGNDIDERGNLHIELTAYGGRGKLGASLDATITQEKADQAVEVVTQVVEAHFT